MEFAKIFGEGSNQVLVTRGSNDSGEPTLKLSIWGGEGLDVCSSQFSWPDNNEGWRKLDKQFEGLTEEKANKVAAMFRQTLEAGSHGLEGGQSDGTI